MMIHIHGRAFPMRIETNLLDLTVGEVKSRIQNLYLIPVGNQTLSFSGERLEDTLKISDYGIGHNAKLDIVVDNGNTDATGVWDHEGRNNDTENGDVTEENGWVSGMVDDVEDIDDDGHWLANWPAVADNVAEENFGTRHVLFDAEWPLPTPETQIAPEWPHPSVETQVAPESPPTYRTNFWGHHFPLASQDQNSMTEPQGSVAEYNAELIRQTQEEIDKITLEVRSAFRAVGAVTAAKKELTKEIDELELKTTDAMVRMRMLSLEMTEAVAKMAQEARRLEAAISTQMHLDDCAQ